MGFTKKIEAAGDWSLPLRTDTPTAVKDAASLELSGFSSLIVTPGWMDPDQVSFAASIYTGVLRLEPDWTELGGAHATIWLGDEDAKGQLGGPVTKITGVNGTLAQWVDSIVGDRTHLSVGTVWAPATPAGLTWRWPGWLGEEVSARHALDYVADAFGVEWRVNDDLTVDVGEVADLYFGEPPIFTGRWSGRDFGTRSVRADMSLANDLEDYTTSTAVRWDDDGTPAIAEVGGGAVPFTGPDGNELVMRRLIDSPDTTSMTAANSLAMAQLGRFKKIRRAVNLTTDHRAVMVDLTCGEPALLWRPERGVMDLDNQIDHRGHTLFPLASRIVGMTMAAEKGLGVYLRRGDGSTLDLTPWVAWETPGSEIEVGAFSPSLAQAMRQRGLRHRT